jgi:hypothetical protein
VGKAGCPPAAKHQVQPACVAASAGLAGGCVPELAVSARTHTMPVLVHTSIQPWRSLSCTAACDKVGKHVLNTKAHMASHVVTRWGRVMRVMQRL